MALEPTKREIDIRNRLKKVIREKISQGKIEKNDIAKQLNLLPVGLEVLLEREEWRLDTIFRIAEAVGLEIEVSVK